MGCETAKNAGDTRKKHPKTATQFTLSCETFKTLETLESSLVMGAQTVKTQGTHESSLVIG